MASDKTNKTDKTAGKITGKAVDRTSDKIESKADTEGKKDGEIEVLEKQKCPICHGDTLTLTEAEKDIPYFGRTYVYSMDCSSCKYHKADVEHAEQKEPCKIIFEISSEQDLKARVVKSSEATIKIPHVMTIESGPNSNGYVTNVEGVLNRVKSMVESTKENEEDEGARKRAKNMLKKLNKVLWGQEKLKMIIEDPSGNSAIISDKAEVGKLKI